MQAVNVSNFNLASTVESGQVFRWGAKGRWYFLVAGDSIIKARQDGSRLFYSSNNDFDVLSFFDLDNLGYDSMLRSFRKNNMLNDAVAGYKGLRIMRQQPWECAVSFICSSNSNIKRIQKNLNSIAEAYGEKIEFDGYVSYSFPSAADIAKNPPLLDGCGLGYRAKYLKATAKKVAAGFDFEALRTLGYEEAKRQLQALDGIGPKVADCILLFSLGFTAAFPVDVWIAKFMQPYVKRKASVAEIAEYGRNSFGKNAGYAQQFIYHYSRNRNI